MKQDIIRIFLWLGLDILCDVILCRHEIFYFLGVFLFWVVMSFCDVIRSSLGIPLGVLFYLFEF